MIVLGKSALWIMFPQMIINKYVWTGQSKNIGENYIHILAFLSSLNNKTFWSAVLTIFLLEDSKNDLLWGYGRTIFSLGY